MRLCFLLCGLLSSLLVHATDFKYHVVRHNSQSISLPANDQHSISQIVQANEDYFVEKINIQTYSLDYVDKSKNSELSEQRLKEVYDFITNLVPDEDNMELVNLNKESIVPRDYKSYTLVEVYLVKKGNEKLIPGIEMVLFPEEFEQEEEGSYIPESFKSNTSFNIKDIYFHGNSAIYKRESEESLEKLYNFLVRHPNVTIRLEGHVNGNLSKTYLKEAGKSNPERKVYNSSQHLSLERARSVKNYLVSKGIDFDRIETVGKGAKDMIHKKPKNRKQEAENRRIEVIIVNS